MARKKKEFSAAYDAGDILGLYQSKLAEGDESRLRNLASAFREHVRLEHAVSIHDQYGAISKEVRTPYLRDAWTRISASLVAKAPVIHTTPKDEARQDYTEAAAIDERFLTALVERLHKETGEDAIHSCASALVRDGESVLKVVHKPDAYANFPKLVGSADEALRAQEDFKKSMDLPVTWRNVDRLQMMFGDGEYGDEWALEYGEYPVPYLKRRYGLREMDGELVNPDDVLGGRPKAEGLLQASPGRAVKVEYFDSEEWHVIINGIEPRGWPRENPYRPHLPYFRAKAHESESLLYSLLWLVPRLDELLTMKLNWAYLGSYPNPIESAVGSGQSMATLDDMPNGNPSLPEKPVVWKPGKYMSMPSGRQLSFLVPPPIGADTNELLQIFKGLIEVAGVPSVMRGSAASGDSGYLANQMLAAASVTYRLAGLALQRQEEQALDFVHWLVSNVIKQTVYVQGWQEVDPRSRKPKTRAGRAWLGLSPDKSSKNVAAVSKLGPVSVQFRPTLPTDEQAKAMIATQLTAGDRPLISMRHAREKWLEEEDPDQIAKEIAVEKALESEPLVSLYMKKAIEEAGLASEVEQAQPQQPAVDPAMLAQIGQMQQPGMIQPQMPGVPGQVMGGLPTIPGLTMPLQPTPPPGVGMPAPMGQAGPGQYPGMPGNQGPPIP